jgi:hypothetical protein
MYINKDMYVHKCIHIHLYVDKDIHNIHLYIHKYIYLYTCTNIYK